MPNAECRMPKAEGLGQWKEARCSQSDIPQFFLFYQKSHVNAIRGMNRIVIM
jgi:hypothetical protein